ncbi:MAG: AsmA family protein [Rhodanobacteraceae bacterium]
MNKRVRVILIVIAGAIVLAVVAGWYVLHDPDRYIPRITAYLREQTGLQVQIRHVEAHLFPALGVRVYGLEIKNPKPFPSGDFLDVPSLDATIKKMPLLDGRIEIQSLVLHKPVIDVISDPDGLWNYQNPASGKQVPVHFPTGVITNLQIEDGVLLGSNLIDPADTPGPVVVEMHDFSAELKQIHFHPRAGSGRAAAIAGTLAAGTVRFGSIHTRDLHAQLRVTSRQVTLKNFVTKTYRGSASGDFTLGYGGKDTTFTTSARVSGIGMPYLLAEFRKGPPAMTGMLQAQLNLAGDIAHTATPLADMHGTGTITIRKGELPSLDTDKDMIEMERFRPASTDALPASAFSTFSGDMELHDNRLYSKRIAVDFYGTNVAGSGSTSVLDGAMDYRGTAVVLQKQGPVTNLFARMFKGAQEKNGRLTFPLRVTGTIAHPKCSIVD